MAVLIGAHRYKRRHGGDVTRFPAEVDTAESNTYPDLRVETMTCAYHVLLGEPLDANGSNMVDADGRNNQTRMAVLVDANGSNMVDANGTDLNSLNTH